MKNFWPNKSTTVRAAKTALQWLPATVAAHWAQHQFTLTRPRPLPKLGQTELPQHTWRLQAEGQQLMLYAWGSLENAERIALLAHGWNGNAWQLYPLVEQLRKEGYTVVAFDQIGHGRSTGRHTTFPQFARNVEKVGRSLTGLDLFVGHSMGGAAGALAISRGLPVKRAVLIAPPADLRVFLARFGLPEEVLKRLQLNLERQEKVELATIVAEEIAPRLTIPALIVVDRSDRETGIEAARRYSDHWPGARLLVTDGWGHNRILENPEVLGQLTLKG